MKKIMMKIALRFEKYSLGKLSIYSIALSGIFLGLLAGAKMLDQFMPKFPLSGVAVGEIYGSVAVLCAIVLPIAPAILTLGLAPLIGYMTGQTQMLNPITFLLDYSVPTFATLLVKLAIVFKIDEKVSLDYQVKKVVKNPTVRKLLSFNFASLEMWAVAVMVIVAAIVKGISHSIGGKVFGAPDLPGSYSFEFNAPFTFVNAGVSVGFVMLVYKPLIQIKNIAILKEANRG